MKQPWPMYVSRLKPRACTEEDLRLCAYRARQIKARLALWSITTLLGLLLSLGAWLAFGRQLLEYITRP